MDRMNRIIVGGLKLLAIAGVAGATCYCYPNITEKACDNVWIDLWRTCGTGQTCPDEVITNPSARSILENLGAGATEVASQTAANCVIQRYRCAGFGGALCEKDTSIAVVAKETVDNNLTGSQCGTGPCLPQQPGGGD